jgi:cytochrome c oxidase subunit 2
VIASHLFVPPDTAGLPAGTEGTFGFPVAAAESAHAFDTLYTLLIGGGILCAIGVAIAARRFIRKGRGTTNSIAESGDAQLQLWWTVVPALFLAVIFVWGATDFIRNASVAADPVQVNVTATDNGTWRVDYPTYSSAPSRETIEGCAVKPDLEMAGKSCGMLDDETACNADENCAWGKLDFPVLVAPKDTPVRVLLTSEGSRHNLSIPAFRLQKRADRGRYTSMTFVATETGDFPMLETPGFGDNAGMIAKLSVVERAAFEAKVKETTMPAIDDMTPEQYGEFLYADLGCGACHSTNGPKLVGPTMQGLWGKDEKLADGSTVKVDLAYFKESLLDPNAKVVDGFPAAMTPFTGRVDDRGIEALAAYVQTLK